MDIAINRQTSSNFENQKQKIPSSKKDKGILVGTQGGN